MDRAHPHASPSSSVPETPKLSQGGTEYRDSRLEEDTSGSDTIDFDDGWTENTNVPRRRMGMIQVASLAINQMVGSGILRVPGSVLEMTGSKKLSIGFWIMAGVYTILK